VAPAARPISIGAAARQAAIDFYFNSLRFVPANMVFVLGLLVVLFAALHWPPAILLALLLAAPLAGIHRMAALLVRGEAAGIADFVDGARVFGLQAIGIAAAIATLGVVLATNLVTGFESGGPLGWFLGATALWGLVALAMFAIAVWPVLVDPSHDRTPLRRRLQLAGLVLVGRPGRLFLVTALIATVLVASTVLLGAIVLVGVSYSSAFGTRWALPAVDELEARFEAARAR